MLFENLRILRRITNVNTDISYDNQDEQTKPTLNLKSTDCLLIGTQYPFNNFFVDITGGNKNDAASVLSLEYWNGSRWAAVVDILDGTSVGGKTFAKPGMVLFTPNSQESGWLKVTNPTISGPPELSGNHIYNLYWLRVKVSQDLAPIAPATDVSFREIGFAWTSGDKMKSIKPEVDRYFNSVSQGKTNWIPEIMTAAKMMVSDMKKADLVYAPQQIVRLDDFWLPCTYKTLWLIYSALGPSYKDTADGFAHQYHKTMNLKGATIDANMDGRVSDYEVNSQVYQGVR